LPPLGDYSANEVLNRKPFGNSLAAAGSIQLLCNPSSAIKTGADDLAANWLRSSDPNFIRMLLILVRPIHASHATPTQFVGSRSLLSQAPGFAAAINRNSAVTFDFGEPAESQSPSIAGDLEYSATNSDG
jgi:hypothetical protein